MLINELVSDVFHTGNPETALWEFKHGNGNFKRGDLISLREIKRRASKHALVHREFNSQKPSPLQPGAPAEPMPMTSDSGDPRLVEHSIYEINMRLQRSEEHAHFMHVRQQTVMDMLGKAMQLNQELARALLTLVPGPEHPVHRDGKPRPSGLVQRETHVPFGCANRSLYSGSRRAARRIPKAVGSFASDGRTAGAFHEQSTIFYQYREPTRVS